MVAHPHKSLYPLRVFRSEAPVETRPAGVGVFQQGAVPTHVFLVEEGIVALTCANEDTDDTILGFRSEGWILGMPASQLRWEEPYSARTIVDSTLRALPTDQFLQALRNDSALVSYGVEILSRDAFDHVARLQSVTLYRARLRVEEFFWSFARASRSGRSEQRVQLPFTNATLACYLAIRPQTLSRILNELQADGSVRRTKGWFIVDTSRLWHRNWPDNPYLLRMPSG